MLCKIADLLVNVPEAGGMSPRCREYLVDQESEVDIHIREEQYEIEKWKNLSLQDSIYLESGIQFYRQPLKFNS